MTKRTNIEGWKNYNGHELRDGQVLMINESIKAYVINNYFITEEGSTYTFTLPGTKIDTDGTYYDQTDNTIVLGKITAIYEEGFLNEIT